MHATFHRCAVTTVILTATFALATAQKREPTEKPAPPKSGFYDFRELRPEFPNGIGIVQQVSCMVSATTQPSIYSGNMLLDCDAEVPHNETTIAVDPLNAMHAVGGYHGYQLSFLGATAIGRIFSTVSVTFDGGTTWQQVVPPITPYQFSGDPALAFNADGRVYLASIADHEGPGGSYTGPSVVVAHSDDGGLSWSNPATVASGLGAVTRLTPGQLVFQDKEFIAVDASNVSPYRNRAYVTWTSFQEFAAKGQFRSPIMVSTSNDGDTWTPAKAISGSSPDCSVQYGGEAPNSCSANQFSSPAVASKGKAYVAFENFNTPAENQYLVVTSSNGGATWSGPTRIGTVYDINYPISSFSGRSTLTGCEFRLAATGNLAVDPSNPNVAYMAWSDNRNGTTAATNNDVVLARSADGGATWQEHVLDTSVNDQFYPWVAVAPDGRVDVGYMDRQYSTGQSVCQYGFTLTRATFDGAGNIATKASVRVDTGLSDAGQSRWFSSSATGGQTLFIGDYNGIAIGSDSSTWSLWTDMRNIVQNPPSSTRNHGQHAVAARR